ncbi:MAG TPA: selenide, water dikinase SelD [Armatimonadota bacterium]|jgi:selenide,water dikinase
MIRDALLARARFDWRGFSFGNKKNMTVIDNAKRRRVMQRSQQLGHCICDPRRGCPCGIFREQGLCPCAGERPQPVDAARVKLTELVHNAGCASKIPPGDLESVLSRLPAVTDPAVLSGLPAGDDAGVYRLDTRTCLVQTVDVMTPCVDDAYTFGRICAANCLSDIYAMGGRPLTALSILAFPSDTLDGQLMYDMMRGAMEVLAAAGCALIGGHSIKDEEIKLGFAITGLIDAAKVIERGTARVGDWLVLTKSLGVGVLNFARQIEREYGDPVEVAASMATLNRAAAEAMVEVGASACTDVTGFGLFGHLAGMARHSGVTARIAAEALPAFTGALDALRAGVVPGAIERNREYVGDDITILDGVDEAQALLGFDAQTSGGLLIAVPQDKLAILLTALRTRECAGAVIGRMIGASVGKIEVVSSTSDLGEMIAQGKERAMGEGTHEAGCCADIFGESVSTAAGSAEAFGALMKATTAGGAIDERAKELINFALVVHSRCTPCLRSHVAKARGMGITDAELDEAAWCAVAMGGAPVRMFYVEEMKALKAEGTSCCGK